MAKRRSSNPGNQSIGTMPPILTTDGFPVSLGMRVYRGKYAGAKGRRHRSVEKYRLIAGKVVAIVNSISDRSFRVLWKEGLGLQVYREEESRLPVFFTRSGAYRSFVDGLGQAVESADREAKECLWEFTLANRQFQRYVRSDRLQKTRPKRRPDPDANETAHRVVKEATEQN